MKRVFCIGNGESRRSIDLRQLREHGKIYGCNALYRDFKPDVLVAVDQGIMHEIYHSGYPHNNECYFRNWSKVPAELYENMIKSGVSEDDIKLAREEGAFYENERTPETSHFVMHGSSVSGAVTIIKKDKSKQRKHVQQKTIKISWIKDNDKSNCINDVLQKKKDPGWAAGPTSGYIACVKEQPDEIYLLGHDLNSTTGKVNNMYKGTDNYVVADHSPTPSVNWVQQWKQTFWDFNGRNTYKKIQFYKVNPNLRDMNEVNKPVLEWDGTVINLKYIDMTEFKKRFNIK
jgi:hypothetical protein